MATFTELSKSFDIDKNKKGKEFEHFVKWFLKNDPEWSTQVDKIWLGKVSVRDYIYKKALRKKESLGIVHKKEYMFIPYGDLKKAKQ